MMATKITTVAALSTVMSGVDLDFMMPAIAAREGLAARYVGRLIRLAFLAPEIVESIVEGRQPITLTAEALTRRIELPLSWCSQRTALNVE